MGGRWRTLSLIYNRINTSSSSKPHFPSFYRSLSLAAATSEIPDPDPIGFGAPELDPCVKIPVKAYFLSTSINLKGIQADNHRNVVPPSSRSSSNYVALRFCDFNLDSNVDGLVEEFAGINRGMEKTGTFTMDKKKLLQLVGKANSNLADVILKVGLFERSEIAWRDAKYAQIYEYLREEYEVAQRFGNLDFKLKFVEHNIHFLQEVLQNRKSDFLEWCIIGLLTIENVLSLYEILGASNTVS
uniref:DUF155 domain-containing protein n=1 Tax=Glycine max TaxID=3847 RepID=A0A0R0L705_SOYBN